MQYVEHPEMRNQSCAQRLDALVTKPGEVCGLEHHEETALEPLGRDARGDVENLIVESVDQHEKRGSQVPENLPGNHVGQVEAEEADGVLCGAQELCKMAR